MIGTHKRSVSNKAHIATRRATRLVCREGVQQSLVPCESNIAFCVPLREQQRCKRSGCLRRGLCCESRQTSVDFVAYAGGGGETEGKAGVRGTEGNLWLDFWGH